MDLFSSLKAVALNLLEAFSVRYVADTKSAVKPGAT